MSASYKKLLANIRDNGGQDWQAAVKAYLKAHKTTAKEKKALGLDIYHILLKEAVANLNIAPEEAKNLAAVKAYFRLPEDAVGDIRRSYAPKGMKMMLDWFLIDGILTVSEQAQLTAFGKEMNLTEEEIEAYVKSATEKKK